MGHLEGNFTPVLYMGRKVPKRLIFQVLYSDHCSVCRANSHYNTARNKSSSRGIRDNTKSDET